MEVELPEGDDAAPAAGQCKIDTNYPPKNFKDAMPRTDRQEWAEAYDKEYQGFKEHGILKLVRQVPGVKILGTTTCTEYKVVNSELKKRKVLVCSMGNQQKEGIHFKAGELYAPVIKATELRAIFALGAKCKASFMGSNTKQVFLNGEIGTEIMFIRLPDWWLEPVPEGYVLQLMKRCTGPARPHGNGTCAYRPGWRTAVILQLTARRPSS